MITRPASVVGSAQRLVGRLWVHRLLDALMEPVEGGGAVALMVGEVGVGKTALLGHVAEVTPSRTGLRVRRAHGEGSEAVFTIAAIADVLLPMREKFGEAPQIQRQTLGGFLTLSSGLTTGRR
jgi:hypothetical protein